MTIIKNVNELIEKSLASSSCYIQKSLKWKDEYPSLARTLYEASLDEMSHMNKLHEEIVRLIQSYRDKHGDPPEAMQAVYDYLHEKHIECAAEIRGLQNMYKES